MDALSFCRPICPKCLQQYRNHDLWTIFPGSPELQCRACGEVIRIAKRTHISGKALWIVVMVLVVVGGGSSLKYIDSELGGILGLIAVLGVAVSSGFWVYRCRIATDISRIGTGPKR